MQFIHNITQRSSCARLLLFYHWHRYTSECWYFNHFESLDDTPNASSQCIRTAVYLHIPGSGSEPLITENRRFSTVMSHNHHQPDSTSIDHHEISGTSIINPWIALNCRESIVFSPVPPYNSHEIGVYWLRRFATIRFALGCTIMFFTKAWVWWINGQNHCLLIHGTDQLDLFHR